MHCVCFFVFGGLGTLWNTEYKGSEKRNIGIIKKRRVWERTPPHTYTDNKRPSHSFHPTFVAFYLLLLLLLVLFPVLLPPTAVTCLPSTLLSWLGSPGLVCCSTSCRYKRKRKENGPERINKGPFFFDSARLLFFPPPPPSVWWNY